MDKENTVPIFKGEITHRKVNGKWDIYLPRWTPDFDKLDNWEVARFNDMEALLKKGMKLFDIGAETGHISAVYAQFVGAENMVLVESNPDNWQNIKAVFDSCEYPAPFACVPGLASSMTKMVDGFPTPSKGCWPHIANTGRLWKPRSYRYLHEHHETTNQWRMDDIAGILHCVPDAITIDVEGAEVAVLQGCEELLKEKREMLVWVSVHEGFVKPSASRHDVAEYMLDLGFNATHLDTDHEHHYRFWKIA